MEFANNHASVSARRSVSAHPGVCEITAHGSFHLHLI